MSLITTSTARPARCIALAATLAAALATPGCGYRDLGQQRTDSAAAWGEIAQLYRARSGPAGGAIAAARASPGIDPQVVEDARGALARADTLAAVPELIGDPRAVDAFRKAQGELTGALFRLVVAAQAVPALRDDAAVGALRQSLTQAEERLAAARVRYQRAAAAYNATAATFPSAVTARLLGFGPVPSQL